MMGEFDSALQTSDGCLDVGMDVGMDSAMDACWMLDAGCWDR